MSHLQIQTIILILLVSLLNSCLNAANGLTGQYYKNNDYTNQQLTRIDDVIDFNWGNSRPTNKVGNDNYSIIWSGYIYIPENANYTFYVAHDDFISVSINGVSRYSNGTWTGGNTNYNTFTIRIIRIL